MFSGLRYIYAKDGVYQEKLQEGYKTCTHPPSFLFYLTPPPASRLSGTGSPLKSKGRSEVPENH
jgi:hypothetical protein